jgi:uncharacterized protein DUF4240
MDIDAFWQLIAGSLEHAPGRAAREHYLEGRLAALAPDGIVAFQAFLDHARDRAFTWDLWGAAMRIFGGWCSDDGFEYFRLWLIGRGRMTFERAITTPDSLAAVPAIQRLAGRPRREWDDDKEWPEWETLNYIAARAYRLATDTGTDDCDEDFYDAVRSQLGGTAFRRHPDGERWDAADELAAAMKIPGLAASFPVNAPA